MTLLLSYCATKASSFIAVHSSDKMTRQGFEEMIINRSVQHPSVDGDEGGPSVDFKVGYKSEGEPSLR